MGIPARDEEQLIARAIESVLAAADALGDPASVCVAVACDSCVDSTARIVRTIARRDPRVALLTGGWRSAGAGRAAAITAALDRASSSGATTSDIWVATTDADTVVPVDWLRTHASSWSRGDHAVAGVVDLVDPHDDVQALFARHYALGHDMHGHVHGANLGIRADAYLAVGGFPDLGLAEDHALWHALRRAGFTCRSSVGLRVTTSARLHGRAAGGFADTLRSLVIGEAAGDAVASA